jgi:hypothetical protein
MIGMCTLTLTDAEVAVSLSSRLQGNRRLAWLLDYWPKQYSAHLPTISTGAASGLARDFERGFGAGPVKNKQE